VVLVCCVALVAGTLLYRANLALMPALPSDMPANSRFMLTGYDLDHNESRGEWVACHPDGGVGESFCRVSDARGTVIYQGNFLPVRDLTKASASPLAGEAETGELLWLKGPTEGMPIPAIPMSDGSVLIPRDDRDALLDRWRRFPEDWKRLRLRR
jgi:hypothetical protein